MCDGLCCSGHTLARLGQLLQEAGAPSVKVVALLDKKGRRRVEFFPDYVGWEVGVVCAFETSRFLMCQQCQRLAINKTYNDMCWSQVDLAWVQAYSVPPAEV